MSIFSKRPALVLISFILGVFLYRYSLFLSLLFLALSLLSLIFLGKKGLVLILCAVLFSFGGLYTSSTEKSKTNEAQSLLDKTDYIKGTVISIPEEEIYGFSAIVDSDGGKIFLMTKESTFKYKDEIILKGKFSLPDKKSRSFDFDYSDYLKSKGIYITCFAEEVISLRNSRSSFNIVDIAAALKEYLLKKASSLWSDETLMFARSILLGDSSLSSQEFREKLANASISHVVSVSGTHVSLVAAAVMFLINKLSLKKRYLKFITLPFVCFFVILVSPAPSAMRSLLMFIPFVVAWIYFFSYDALTSLIVSGTLILLYNPFSAFSLNFLLSFGAIWGIILFTKPFIRYLKIIPIPYITDCLSVTLAAQVFILPVLLFTFGKIPLFSLLANLLIVPLIPFIMGFGYLALALPGGLFFDFLTDLLIGASIKIAGFFGKAPFSNLSPAYSPALFMATFISFILLLVFFFIKKNKIASFILLNLCLLSLLLTFISPSVFPLEETRFLDCERGSCTIAINGSCSVMVDLESSENDFSKNTLIPYLKRNGHSSLDVLALTEYNNSDEIIFFLQSFPVRYLILPENTKDDLLLDFAKSKGCKVIFASENDSFTIGGITLFVPYEALGKATYIIENNGGRSLVTGDINVYEEEALAESLSESRTPIDVLIAPRNGNKGSCTASLLKSANPKSVIVSTNRNLSDNFAERLHGFNLLSTKDSGDIVLKKGMIIPYKKR